MEYFYTIWFTIGIITFLLEPNKDPDFKDRVQHFFGCLLIGPVILSQMYSDSRAKKRKDDDERKNKN